MAATYRVTPWGTPARSARRKRRWAFGAVDIVAVLVCGLMHYVYRDVYGGPLIGPTQPPRQGQTAIGWNGGQLRTFGRQRPVPIGSVAKVMTAYVVLRHHPLPAGQPGPTLHVDKTAAADYQERSGSDQSLVPVHAGDSLTERQALQALLVPSGNNIADLLARWDAGSIASFVREMNAMAAALGLHDTKYSDPSGYAPATVSTAVDQTRLAQDAGRIPALLEIGGLRSVNLPRAGTERNYNALLGHDGVIGLKTGTTDQGGGNFVFLARRGHSMLAGAVLAQRIGASTRDSLATTFGIARYLIEQADP
jgi:D-alanyl-D-alanine carboxypeptidase (penicillin-binding protein 5/6)